MNREIDQDLPWASRHRAWLLFWGILAAANLGAGLAISGWAERQSDLRRVAEWCALWTQGVNVYGLRAEFVDYPPHAIVLLSPLAWVQSFEHLVGVWAAANLMLAVTAAYLAVRLVRPGASLHAAAVPVLMFLTWGGFRTLLQFSLLALTLGLAATVLANRRPIVSGVLLGLSLIKPQVAIPFVLWAVFERRRRQISVAVGTMSAGYVLFSIWSGASAARVALDYAGILRTLYTGEASMQGLAQLRPLLAAVLHDWALADVTAGILATILLAGIYLVGRTANRPTETLGASGLAAIWSLLTCYHLTYGFIILLPLAAFLLVSDDAPTRAGRLRVFWFLQTGLMVDLTTVWRWAERVVGGNPTVGAVVFHVDRVLAAALFVTILALVCESRRKHDASTRQTVACGGGR
jgi:hypothetical protein